jgi:hypothetical protein
VITNKFELKSGRWVTKKKAKDDLFYDVNMATWLPTGVNLSSVVSAVANGVTISVAPVIQGTKVIVKLSGLDLVDGAVNNCIIELLMSNSETVTVTMWFEKAPG